MSTHGTGPSSTSGRRSTSSSVRRGQPPSKKPVQSENGSVNNGNTSKPNSPPSNGERTVKKLRLSKALTIPEGTTVYDACRRMAARAKDDFRKLLITHPPRLWL